MSNTRHPEIHFTSGDLVRDIVIGMADGLTVPFALAAGISGAIDSNHIVVTAGLAEIAAGSIAMGLGGYLAARSDAEHYGSERLREQQEIIAMPEEEKNEVIRVFEEYGLSPDASSPVVNALSANPEAWVDFMMRFELGLEKPQPGRALRSATTIAAAYICGGFIPLSPYLFRASAHEALVISCAVTLAALAVFGYLKGKATGSRPLRSAMQTTLIGGLAAGAAFLIARAIS